MTMELMMLACSLALALVQVFLVTQLRTSECGLPYNASPRDLPPPVPPSKFTARMMRAQANLFETLPIFIGAVLIAHVAQIHSTITMWGSILYFAARVAYVPVYGFGIPYVRTLIWAVSIIGILMLLGSVL